MTKNLVTGFIITAIVIAIVSLVHFAVKRSEQLECQKWAEQAQDIPDFYYTEWQKQQCNIK